MRSLHVVVGEVLHFHHQYGLNIIAAFTQAVRIQGSILGGYYTSILIYRGFFHPSTAFQAPSAVVSPVYLSQ